MNIFDYEQSSDMDKTRWLDSFQMQTGLPYFGGKTYIGKYLANHILNMAVKMKQDNKKADIFIDGFTGGGKIALSMPEGWFDTIIMNDLNYGIYCYYTCCKEKPDALIKMIEVIGNVMSKDMFQVCLQYRSNKQTDTKVEPLVSAAMTYWVTHASFNGVTSDKAFYKLGLRDNHTEIPSKANEREDIERIVKKSKVLIKSIHNKMVKGNIVVENLDYRELIKKYNGMEYQTALGDKQKIKEYNKCNKLWYFDPPYHKATLWGARQAPYEDTFPLEMTKEMTDILHGDYAEIYGEIPYFIKSDYNPKYTYTQFMDEYKDAESKYYSEQKKKSDSDKMKKYTNYMDRMKKQMQCSKDCYHDFDKLEDNVAWEGHTANISDPVFYVKCVGEFYKASTDLENGTKMKGREYIWCRGNYIAD